MPSIPTRLFDTPDDVRSPSQVERIRSPDAQNDDSSERCPRTTGRRVSSADAIVTTLPVPLRQVPRILDSQLPSRVCLNTNYQDSHFSAPSTRSTSPYTRVVSRLVVDRPKHSITEPTIEKYPLEASSHYSDTNYHLGGDNASSNEYCISREPPVDLDRPQLYCQSIDKLKPPPKATRIPHSKAHRSRAQHRRKHKLRYRNWKACGDRNRTSWWLQSCQPGPPAPTVFIEPGACHNSEYLRRNSSHDKAHGSCQPLPLTRRWSSIEVEASQPAVKSTPSQTLASSETLNSPQHGKPGFAVEECNKSSNATANHNVVRAVPDAPPKELEAPATIILRQASGEIKLSNYTSERAVISAAATVEAARLTALANPQKSDQGERTSFLITNTDIDFIAELVKLNLRRNAFPQNYHLPLSGQGTIGTIIRAQGSFIDEGIAIESETTAAEAHGPHNCSQTSVAQSEMQDATSGASSQRSVDQLAWEGSEPATSRSFDMDAAKPCKQPQSQTMLYPERSRSVSPHQAVLKLSLHQSSKNEGDPLLDSHQAKCATKNWPGQHVPSQSELVTTVADSESKDTSTLAKLSSQSEEGPRSPVIPHGAHNIISFPPLPTRKTTKEWYLPLLDIGAPQTDLSSFLSLHDVGIDASFGGSVAGGSTAKRCQIFFSPPPGDSTPQALAFGTDHETRRKSVLKVHPNAPARVGERSAMGSSIGSSCGERRMSSMRGPHHVRTIDKIHEEERPDSWVQARRPPSVCPPPTSPSLEEGRNQTDSISIATLNRPATKLKTGHVDMIALRGDTSWPLPATDHPGIYGALTGTGDGKGSGTCKNGCGAIGCGESGNELRSPSVDWIG